MRQSLIGLVSGSLWLISQRFSWRLRAAVAPPVAPIATAAPAPTATPAPATSQLVSLRGKVASVNTSAGTFTVTTDNSTVTVATNTATQFSGSANNLSALQPGWQVTARGTTQADGSLLAISVSSSSDN